MTITDIGDAKAGDLLFVPLGGCGEIGMNLNLYGLDGQWIMLDLGVTFGEDNLPGIDVVMPDPSFIQERADSLLAIVLTHAHEDHLGAVQHLWPRFRCPVYATPFSAALLRRKLEETDFADAVEIVEIPLGGRVAIGPFELEFVSVTHSILEPNAIAIKTRHGTVLHTGDFKIDPEPLIGEHMDEPALRRLGDGEVLAMICDSTNVFRPGESGSEAALRQSLDGLIGGRSGRIAVTTFASNVARLKMLGELALRHDRSPALVGRSLWRIVETACEAGYGAELPDFLGDRDAGYLPDEHVLLICTGCQGEPRGAMARIASGSHPHIGLGRGDLVIFSSKIIPGNEKAIFRLHNQLVEAGVEVVTEKDHFVHVSGHPSRDELAAMYRWVRPKIAVPVHGERRHIEEHVAFARSLQVPEAFGLSNGSVLRLAPGGSKIVGMVESGRLALDGRELIQLDSSIIRQRRRLMHGGAAFVTMVLDRDGALLSPPRLKTAGLFEDEGGPVKSVEAALHDEFGGLPSSKLREDEAIREKAHAVVRRAFKRDYDKRPEITIELIRV